MAAQEKILGVVSQACELVHSVNQYELNLVVK